MTIGRFRVQERQRLGEFLKNAREKAKLSQADVADKLKHRTPQAISNIERGVSALPAYVLREMVKMYKMPQNEVINTLSKLQSESLRNEIFGVRRK